jgi:cell division septation protein DedD
MEATIDITAIVDSAQHGQWLLFAGLLLTALVQIARAIIPKMKKIPKRVLPWVIAIIGVLAAGGGVLAGGGSWQAALTAGITVGLASLGTYDLLKGPSGVRFKRVEEKPAEEKPAEEKPAEEKPAEEKPAEGAAEAPAEEGSPTHPPLLPPTPEKKE